MAGDDEHTVRLDRAALNGENVGDLGRVGHAAASHRVGRRRDGEASSARLRVALELLLRPVEGRADAALRVRLRRKRMARAEAHQLLDIGAKLLPRDVVRSEEHTSELQSLMRISYAVFCLKKKKI